jgi:hypothetical protein
LLPKRASLLRAPDVRQLNLEDWLLEQTVRPSEATNRESVES